MIDRFYLYARKGGMIALVAHTTTRDKRELAGLVDLMLEQMGRYEKHSVNFLLVTASTREIVVDYRSMITRVLEDAELAKARAH